MTENEIWRTLSHGLNTDGTESMRHIHFAPQAIKLARGSTTRFDFESHLWMPTGRKSVTEAMMTSKSSNIYVYSSGNEWAGSLENLVNQQHGTELPISSRDALKEWE